MPAMTVHGHDHKPTPKFHRGGAGLAALLFLGFENEVEIDADDDEYGDDVGEECRKSLNARYKSLVYCKEDGSIDSGFEVVSHPMSWGWIQSNKARLSGLLDTLKRKGAIAEGREKDCPENCGLHIHIGRKAIGNFALKRMMDFVYGNPKFIHKISRRDSDSLAEWASVYLDDCDGEARSEALDIHTKSKERCLALNTLPTKTVEFRIFRGTLNPDNLMLALEFAAGLVYFAKGDTYMDMTAFTAFTEERREDFPHLHEFVKRYSTPRQRRRAQATAVA